MYRNYERSLYEPIVAYEESNAHDIFIYNTHFVVFTNRSIMKPSRFHLEQVELGETML